jgi:predicted DNA-binding transcriptional regulator YafY
MKLTVPVESLAHAPVEFLRFGGEAEVLSPPEVRQAVADAAAALAAVYHHHPADAG